MSSLVLSDGGGVAAKGDVADLVRIVAGFYGPLFLAVFLLKLIFSWRQRRDDQSLAATVRALRRRAREQEEQLRADYNVGVDEAVRRLERLRQGFYVIVVWLTSLIPADYNTGSDEASE